MLLQFAVENFQSIKAQVVLSMIAPEGETLDRRHVRRVGDRWSILNCAAVYGANAAGKSNLVRALSTLRDLVCGGVAPTARIGVDPFRLDAEWGRKPTRFEVDLLLDGVHHAYGLVASREAVVAEWLHRIEGDKVTPLFEREADADGGPEHVFRFDDGLAHNDEQRQFLRFVGKGTRPNQPFLAECTERNVTVFQPLVRWFRDKLSIIRPDAPFVSLVLALEDAPTRQFVTRCLRGWGTGVVGVDVHREPFDGLEKLDEERRPTLLKHLGERGPLAFITRRDEPAVTLQDDEGVWLKRIQFRHASDESVPAFEWRDESDGTRRLMHLLPVLSKVQKGASADPVFVVDELERSLHASLTRRFVEEFLSMSAAVDSGGQLIFTTHDTNLLNGRLLPPASIWFVEKDHNGATHLYSLAEYPPEQIDRLTDRLEDGYLQGRFGAIPFMASREQLAWGSPGAGE